MSNFKLSAMSVRLRGKVPYIIPNIYVVVTPLPNERTSRLRATVWQSLNLIGLTDDCKTYIAIYESEV